MKKMSFSKSNLLFAIVACIKVTIIVCCRNGVLLTTGITSEERTELLDEHNRLRQLVALGKVYGQPGAENMQEMQWDDELAKTAQQWANQCSFQHDPVKYLSRFEIGQNLAIMWSTAPLPDDEGVFVSRVKKWFNEVYKYAFGSPWSLATGHYTQLIWSDTNLMGCGFAYYQSAKQYSKLFVCNYGPGGNINGVKPYETGSPSCENHELIPSTRYDGLCHQPTTSNNQYQYNYNGYYAYNNADKNQYDTKYTFVPTNNNNNQPTNQNYQTNKFNNYNQNQYNFPSSNNKKISNYPNQQQQTTTQKPTLSTNSPYNTYRWDLLFKNSYNYKNQ